MTISYLEKRRQLARMVKIAKQKEELQIDVLQRSFTHAENQLGGVLRKRKREVKVNIYLLLNNKLTCLSDLAGL